MRTRMHLLLLSSSRTPAGYLTDYLGDVKPFTADVRRAVFVPFAAVSLSWDDYAKRVLAKAKEAIQSVAFKAEIAPVTVVSRKGTEIVVTDEQPL